jgi:circadian clock protein KaiC
MEAQNSQTKHFLSTGVPGLDQVLTGGLTSDRLYLVEGEPGTGKTTLALQFLNEGARQGESVLYITLAETNVELRSVASSHGWGMEGIHIEEILPNEDVLDPDQQYGNRTGHHHPAHPGGD